MYICNDFMDNFRILFPIVRNRVYFFNIILLLIIPSMMNAYWINHEQYVTISSMYKYGIKIRDGANFPYIIFIPFVVAYFICALDLTLKCFVKSSWLPIKMGTYFFFMMLFAVNVFLLMNFGTMISPSIIMLMVETNGEETSEFFKTYFFCGNSLLAYFIILLASLYVFFSERKFSAIIKGKWKSSLVLIICIYFFQRSVSPLKIFSELFDCRNLSEAELWYLKYPVNTNALSNLVYSVYVMNLSKFEMREAVNNTLAISGIIETTDDVNLVLIIGESYSKHHSNLYDYPKNTNPRLRKRMEDGNLFVFNDVVSSYNLTSFVLRNLFSVNSIMDGETWSSYPAFPILFKNAGYNVYFWDNQRTFGKADVSDFSIASYLFNDSILTRSYTSYNHQTYSYDKELIDDFWSHVSLDGDKNLIIFHLMGQHTMPDKRYPPEKGYDYFTKDSVQNKELSDKQKKQVAQYDNATRYNDFLIDDLLNRLTDKKVVAVYFSDHGEEIFDFRKHYGRTQEKQKTANLLKYQYEIPFMIWCSNQYAIEYPNVVDQIKLSINRPFMNDNVCQILFGLVGMKTFYYHPNRDLISPQYKAYDHRNVQGVVNYEKIRWGK